MALLTSEIVRIKYELGYNVLAAGAEPYIGVHAVFDQVIAAYMTSGATTTSATAVTAASAPTPVTLTLAAAAGFAEGARVVVDVDDRQEFATVQTLSGTSLTLALTRAHSGTYPMTVEGGESIIRELLLRIRAITGEMSEAAGEGSLKKVDEVEFYANGTKSAFESMGSQLAYWRNELALALGVRNLRALRGGGGQSIALY